MKQMVGKNNMKKIPTTMSEKDYNQINKNNKKDRKNDTRGKIHTATFGKRKCS